jgi:hypothetical protein
MSSRERVNLALNHEEPDMVPLDLGGSPASGIEVGVLYRLRQALGLDEPGTPVKVVEPYQMLGEVKPDFMDALGIDVAGMGSPKTLFGFKNENWKPWTTFDGTPVLVPEAFNTDPEPNGDILMYPDGDRSAPPSGRMPKDGFYFDTIIRQEPIDDEHLNVEDNLEEFAPISDEELDYLRAEAKRLYVESDKAIMGNFGGTSFGDIALVPAPWLKHPKGIRDITEWYISTVSRRDHVYRIFERQCEIALANLERIYGAVGNRVTAIWTTGTDLGTQNASFISLEAYRDLFKPFHKAVNDWLHKHTGWKSMIHSCGSVRSLIEDFIDAGFDILNPVQCSAANMNPSELKSAFGDRITFWGGGVDTQHTLPFGTPKEVRKEVRKRIKTFAPGGGFVFATVHNIQSRVPVENLLAMFETVQESRSYR